MRRLRRVVDGVVKYAQTLRTHGAEIAGTFDCGRICCIGDVEQVNFERCFNGTVFFGIGAKEGSGRLNGGDVIVENTRKRPSGGADELRAIFVLINGISCVKELFNSYNWESHGDPILGRVDFAVRLIDTVISKPGLNEVERVIGWSEEMMDLLLRQMLAISRVRWIGN